MNPFPVHTIETAPEASKPLLAAARRAYGFLPNLLSGMATSPALLEGYMALSGIFNKTDLSETERQIILMTSNRLNGCVYCMAAHTTISQGAKVPADVIAALRDNTPIAEPKLEALRQFTISVVETRGWPTDADSATPSGCRLHPADGAGSHPRYEPEGHVELHQPRRANAAGRCVPDPCLGGAANC